MSYEAVFRRHEMKFLMTKEKYSCFLSFIHPYMAPDSYGVTTIRNIYFDTDHLRLIRRSIERPVYKEKLRLRSYERAAADGEVFVELKKKYDSVVYKRRVAMKEATAVNWLCNGDNPEPENQITREITYFRSYYETLKPRVFLSYDRRAYYCREGGDLRITFDENILCRANNLSLREEIGGTSILNPELVLMEIKTAGGLPLWLTEILSRQHLYKSAFSKYGTAYQTIIFPKCKGELFHA